MRELVTEQGYAHVTIEKIAARAGVGKPTVYRWWQSKNAILAECVLSGDVLPTPVATDSPSGVRADPSEWITAVLTYVDENAPLLRGLVASAFEDPDIARQLSTHLADPLEVALQAWASEPGASAPHPAGISPRALAQLLLGAILYRLSRPPGASDDPTEELFGVLVSRLQAS
ncbi:TetR/AcrR family transcriptional regulator [Subtercola vilae]|uniref:TetR/AcrR family transcriptional regulator n=2 Tax=Microbacteriaceae TaxID=85023 RepID=A0A4T2C8A5_9MICO|nr:TetR/AcrR family transcriptional regulator [Subtercola vilae]